MSAMNQLAISEKLNITIEEAAAYSGIGQHKIRKMMRDPDCDFVLKVGSKKSLIKRVKFEQYVLSRIGI